ncbi:MAG: zinc-ribbon domain-containing protein [Oscillospiraceae bacterium]|nr:zinc-ribbon domain-containing protein [Oscillospiraceae bacterium]
MRFCTNCGTQLEESLSFCPNCGTKAGNDAPNEAAGRVGVVPNSRAMGICAQRVVLIIVSTLGVVSMLLLPYLSIFSGTFIDLMRRDEGALGAALAYLFCAFYVVVLIVSLAGDKSQPFKKLSFVPVTVGFMQSLILIRTVYYFAERRLFPYWPPPPQWAWHHRYAEVGISDWVSALGAGAFINLVAAVALCIVPFIKWTKNQAKGG